MESRKRNTAENRRPARARTDRPRANSAAKPRRKANKQIRGADNRELVEGFTPQGIARAERVIAFIEQLRIPSGIGQGEPFLLRPWQKREIYNIYAPTIEGDPKRRRIRRALISIGRKNGKTALAAALVLVHLVGPEAKVNGEVYSAASDRNQAAHIYKVASQMIALDDELSAMCKCLDTVKRIVCYHLGSFYVSLSADARRQHGFNPSFVVYDELAQALNRDLYDVLTTSFGAQKEGLFLAISTQSSDPQSIMSEMADDAIKQEAGELNDPYFYGKVYAVPETSNPYDEKEWIKANPGLGDFRDLDDLRALAEKARRSPSAEAAFRNLYLNQRVDGTQSLVNSMDWRACDGEIDDNVLRNIDADGGLDLSTRQDLTALTLSWPLPNGVIATKSWFWTPENMLEEREKQDGAHYNLWKNQGFLTVLPGKSVDYATVALHIKRIVSHYRVRRIRYDRYRIDDLRQAMENCGLTEDKCEFVEHGQGYKDMAPAVDALEEIVIQQRLRHGGNPLLTYCMRNVKVVSDPAGNRKFDKRQRNRRIDGAVTLAMSLTSLNKPIENKKSYIERIGGVLVL